MSALKDAVLFLLKEHRTHDGAAEDQAKHLAFAVINEPAVPEPSIQGEGLSAACYDKIIIEAVKTDILSEDSVLIPAASSVALNLIAVAAIDTTPNVATLVSLLQYEASHAEPVPPTSAPAPETLAVQ